jgi:mannose-1-phosphate guanylyltransferase
MFLASLNTWHTHLKESSAELKSGYEYLEGTMGTSDLHLSTFFDMVPSVPIDVALMEKAQVQKIVFTLKVGWSDVGTWKGLKLIVQRYNLKCPPRVIQILEEIEII